MESFSSRKGFDIDAITNNNDADSTELGNAEETPTVDVSADDDPVNGR